MIKKFLFIIGSSVLMATGLNAQSHRICGTMEHHQMLLDKSPELAKSFNDIERHTQRVLRDNSAQKLNGTIITIPVVVHVVYNTAAQNVSDAAINAQIDVLNKDFRKLNADASSVPSLFAGLAADCEIQFCLAKRDPQGLASTGIVRKSTTTTAFSTNDAVKNSSTGGDNAWDASRYLNLWVCNLSGGVLGYAQFPGGPASTDGVVLLFSSLPGGSSAPYNLGRTATHEVGHWLNLRHIWGDATCGSDLVSDTPLHNTANYGCPTYPHLSTCTGTPVEMTMNYMDYTDDACMYMFTLGQRDRINALFGVGGSRASLLSSNGCTPVAPSLCNIPTGLNASAVTTTSATLNWSAASGAFSYNVRYRQVGTSTWTNGSTAGLSFPVSGLISSTSYEFQVATVCSAGNGDFSSSATFSTGSTGVTYCASKGNSQADEWIDLVRLGSINRTSGADAGYILSTATTSVVRGSSQTVSYSAGFRSGYSARQYWKVYIDWNNNGLFTDAGETVVNRNSTSSGTLSTTFTVPSTAALGTIRMRVSMKWNSTQTACETFSYGEVEDYNITVTSAREIQGASQIAMEDFALYPNPASEAIKLNLPLDRLVGGFNLQVMDMSGRIVKSVSGENLVDLTETGISVQGMKQGLYFLTGTIGEEKVNKRFSVQ